MRALGTPSGRPGYTHRFCFASEASHELTDHAPEIFVAAPGTIFSRVVLFTFALSEMQPLAHLCLSGLPFPSCLLWQLRKDLRPRMPEAAQQDLC